MVYLLPSVLTYHLCKFSEHTTSSTRLLHGLATSKLWLMFFWHLKNSHMHENSRRLKENNIIFKSSSGCSTLFQFAVPYTSDQEACVTKSWTKDMGCQILQETADGSGVTPTDDSGMQCLNFTAFATAILSVSIDTKWNSTNDVLIKYSYWNHIIIYFLIPIYYNWKQIAP